ncbi:benzoquinone reductase [Serendipita vermifera MAFF 305830]|uniref:Benzoquinone reductase n=1 Tax=Serendipita vermifera MAFF 305830 TaxID=933852 RepID=A0A0C3BGA2_SERVB|nr:benzoquinone reductase [Serendipita vermifera MAFF 305830]
MSGPKIAIVIYSMYGHIAKMAEAAKKGIEEAGGQATILQVPETLPQEVLTKMYAPPKPDYPIATPATLLQYEGFLFGISTRYGNWPGQFKAFWDASGQVWATGGFHGKFASVFVSTSGPGGGQESTFLSTFSTLVHHGIIFVPLGYKNTNTLWNDHFDEVRGGSPFGAGTFSKNDGSRQPTELELKVAGIQGSEFYKLLKRYVPQSTAKGMY